MTVPTRLHRLLTLAVVASTTAGCERLISDAYEYGQVEVRVERRNGEPVPGAEVLLYVGARPMDVGQTGADGRHVFRFVPFGKYGVATGVPEGYARIEWVLGGPPSGIRDGIVMVEGGREELSFVLVKQGPGTVLVTASRPSGEAIEGVPVELYRPQGTFATDTTDASGEARFDDVPFGNYGLVATRPPRFTEPGEEVYLFRERILVEEDVTESLDLTLVACEGTILVEVRSTEGGPVEGFPVVLYDSRAVRDRGETGPDGRHAFQDVICRDHGVALGRTPGWIVEDGRGTSFVDGITPTREEGHRSFTFEVEPCQGRLGVRTFDPDGAPVSGVPVRLYTATGILEEGRTEDGLMMFGEAPCGNLGVALLDEPGWEFEDGRGTSFVDGITVTDGSDVFVDFTVRRCEGTITAHVVDQNGDGVSGAGLVLYTSGRQVAVVRTPASGMHVFESVGCAESWGLSVDPPNGYTVTEGRGSSWFDAIEVDEGSEQTFTFTLRAQ